MVFLGRCAAAAESGEVKRERERERAEKTDERGGGARALALFSFLPLSLCFFFFFFFFFFFLLPSVSRFSRRFCTAVCFEPSVRVAVVAHCLCGFGEKEEEKTPRGVGGLCVTGCCWGSACGAVLDKDATMMVVV